jgi:hypothetical protein
LKLSAEAVKKMQKELPMWQVFFGTESLLFILAFSESVTLRLLTADEDNECQMR